MANGTGAGPGPNASPAMATVFMRLSGRMRARLAWPGWTLAGGRTEFRRSAPRCHPRYLPLPPAGPKAGAELTYVGTPLAPYPLVRVARRTALGPFEEARVYDRDNVQTAPDPIVEEPEPARDAEPEPTSIGADFLEGL